MIIHQVHDVARLLGRLVAALLVVFIFVNYDTLHELSPSSSKLTYRAHRDLDSTEDRPHLHEIAQTADFVQNATDLSSRRKLFKLSDFLDPKSTSDRIQSDQDLHPQSSIQPYSLHNILLALPHFRRELFILHYSATSDGFHVYINESKEGWVTALQNRIYQIMPMLSYALRTHFPNRFDKQEDFVLLASSGDEPKLDCACFDTPRSCKKKEFAPILQFGAVFREESILPSLVTMPVWHHLPCLRQWQQTKTICPTYRERAANAGLIGEQGKVIRTSMGLEQIWSNLIPQIVWRGSDFGFLWCIHPQLRLIDYEMDIAKRISLSQCGDSARGILQCLSQMWEILTPRWRAVVWSLEAQLNQEEKKQTELEGDSLIVPWIDAKFTVKTRAHGQPLNTKHIERYTPYTSYGLEVASPDFMTLSDLSQYKYQFDIGGGGGTTFSGTIEKLAMPGVLFHHMTSTKDYYHDDLVPWMHFIPVEEGLSDLREMHDWAVANEEQAMRISEAATEYARSWSQPEVLDAMYQKYFVEALGRVVDAYEPSGEDVGEVLKKRQWTLIAKGSGRDLDFKYTKEPST